MITASEQPPLRANPERAVDAIIHLMLESAPAFVTNEDDSAIERLVFAVAAAPRGGSGCLR